VTTTSPFYRPVATAASYPYTAVEAACRDEATLKPKYGIWLLDWKGYYNATGMDESYILNGLKTGVVGGAVYVDETLWYAYKNGILSY